MDPLTIALLGGGMGLLGFLGQQSTNSTNKEIAEGANQFSAQQSAMQREWMERMSNTSYQRAMADMRAAGLNPMLAFSQGGASTPSAGAPSGATTRVENSVGAGVNSAVSTATLMNQLNAQRSTQGLQTAQSMQAAATANKADADTAYIMDKNAREAGMYSSAKRIQERQDQLDAKHLERERILRQVQLGTSSAKDVIRAINPLKLEFPNKPKTINIRPDRGNSKYWGE